MRLSKFSYLTQTAVPALVAANAATAPADDGEHQVIAIFSPKGGAGRTTIATNLAVALHRDTGARVCLMDANLQFGDVGVLLNLNPKDRSIAEAVETGEPDDDIIDSVVVDHSTLSGAIRVKRSMRCRFSRDPW